MLGKTNAVVNVSGDVDVVQDTISYPLSTFTWSKTNITSYTGNPTQLNSSAIVSNSNLKFLDFGNSMGIINGNGISSNPKLNYIVLRKTSLVSLNASNSISNNGTQNDNPNHIIYIYVPSTLIERYKTATNWSTLYNNGKVDFLPITE